MSDVKMDILEVVVGFPLAMLLYENIERVVVVSQAVTCSEIDACYVDVFRQVSDVVLQPPAFTWSPQVDVGDLGCVVIVFFFERYTITIIVAEESGNLDDVISTVLDGFVGYNLWWLYMVHVLEF